MKYPLFVILSYCILLLPSIRPVKQPGSSFHVSAEETGPASVRQQIINPVFNYDFPDPTVIRAADGKYYAYATEGNANGKHNNIQVASSTDLVHWTTGPDILPGKPAWADHHFWAPHVLYDRKLKKYVLFYSGESKDTSIGKCLGVAFADKPGGPFVDKGSPLLCGKGFENIDPMAFVDPASGKKLLYWGSGFQPIRVQEMRDDWKAFKNGTEPVAVMQPAQEKNYNRLIEGAWVDFYKGKYYLYYSGDNCCGDRANYAVMVARANKPTGPFQRLGEANGSGNSVVLEKDSTWLAPGHNSIIRDANGNIWTAYHAMWRDKEKAGPARGTDNYRKRVMCISKVIYKNDWPEIIK